jgi:sarcosine oxidase / L-pipecolate oxidase
LGGSAGGGTIIYRPTNDPPIDLARYHGRTSTKAVVNPYHWFWGLWLWPPLISKHQAESQAKNGCDPVSTALALSRRSRYSQASITVLDKSPFPSPDGASIDSSRIVRADYADPAYASLAAEAQALWRGKWGEESRYSESGLVMVADEGKTDYVRKSFENVKGLQDVRGIEELKDRGDIKRTMGTGGANGNWGYVNWNSGWADAEAGIRLARALCEESGRVQFMTAEVLRLARNGRQVIGVELAYERMITADLVILATGAWTGRLVDLRGRADASGHVLAYLELTPQEQQRLGGMPVLLNFSTGMFIIPPRNGVLKVARHDHGYKNPQRILNPEGDNSTGSTIETSLPRTQLDEPGQWIPNEGEAACRRTLAEVIPSLASRPFKQTRICWYTDT